MPARTRRAAIVSVALTLAVAACGGGTDKADDESPSSSAVTTSTSTSTSTIPEFAGPGDFYDVPEPLASGEPGALIRYQPVADGSAPDRLLWRVMYHSRDASDRDVAVTGLVSVPTAPAPEGGWRTLAWGHGTSGMAPNCAPSRKAKSVPSYDTATVVAASDYVGLGPNGQRHAFLSGVSEGRSVIDSVRAAGQIPGVSTSAEWAAVGISQGGHAILFASELAAEYAPELSLLGAAVMAPATELDRNFPGDIAPLVTVLRTMATYGAAVDHPDFHPEQYATPELQAASAQLDTVCIDAIGAVLATIPADRFWTTDPLGTDVGKQLMAETLPGREVIPRPLLIVQGDADIVVVPARTQAFFDRICALGQDVRLETIPGADHNMKSDAARATMVSWLADLMDGTTPPSNCPGAAG